MAIESENIKDTTNLTEVLVKTSCAKFTALIETSETQPPCLIIPIKTSWQNEQFAEIVRVNQSRYPHLYLEDTSQDLIRKRVGTFAQLLGLNNPQINQKFSSDLSHLHTFTQVQLSLCSKSLSNIGINRVNDMITELDEIGIEVTIKTTSK